MLARVKTLVGLLLGWAAIALYIYAGGVALRRMELEHERKTATDYCVKVDALLSGLAPAQRRRFSTLLNTLVGRGMCRAPLCKAQVLPNVQVSFNLATNLDCFVFMQSYQAAFTGTVEKAFSVMPETGDVLAIVNVLECVDVRRGRGAKGRILTGENATSANLTTISLTATVRSDTMQAVERINEASKDQATFMRYYKRCLKGELAGCGSGPRERRRLANAWSAENMSFSVDGLQTPVGEPVMVIDASQIDSYPGTIFQQPDKAPGEPLDGFAALDPATGKISRLKATAAQSSAVAVAAADVDACAGNQRRTRARQRRRLLANGDVVGNYKLSSDPCASPYTDIGAKADCDVALAAIGNSDVTAGTTLGNAKRVRPYGCFIWSSSGKAMYNSNGARCTTDTDALRVCALESLATASSWAYTTAAPCTYLLSVQRGPCEGDYTDISSRYVGLYTAARAVRAARAVPVLMRMRVRHGADDRGRGRADALALALAHAHAHAHALRSVCTPCAPMPAALARPLSLALCPCPMSHPRSRT